MGDDRKTHRARYLGLGAPIVNPDSDKFFKQWLRDCELDSKFGIDSDMTKEEKKIQYLLNIKYFYKRVELQELRAKYILSREIEPTIKTLVASKDDFDSKMANSRIKKKLTEWAFFRAKDFLTTRGKMDAELQIQQIIDGITGNDTLSANCSVIANEILCYIKEEVDKRRGSKR